MYLASQVRELDRITIEEHGVDGYELMQRAGAAAFGFLRRRWPRARRISVVCGSGNNGGDGYVLARFARTAGMTVELVELDGPKTPTAEHARRNYVDDGGTPSGFEPASGFTGDVVVDGLLGTGLERDVTGRYATAIDLINGSDRPVLALDIPSGLHADSGRVMGTAVRAHATVTFIGVKVGLLTGHGRRFAGEIGFHDLAVPADIYAAVPPVARRIDPTLDPAIRLPRRSRDAHKGNAGTVLVVGSDLGMTGAARMCAQAAYRGGAGLVRVATRREHAAALAAACPEIMVYGVGGPADLAPLAAAADVVAIGPGLGRGEWGRGLLAAVLEQPLPLVVDADALNLLAGEPLRRNNWILTPHPGEAARLLGTTAAAVQADRIGAVRRLVDAYGGCAVLKGSGTLVAADALWLCDRGNPGMASGGMGDVLTGVIAALIAQGAEPAAAARYGVWLHASAADRDAAQRGEIGLMATDLLQWLRGLINTARQ